MTIDLSAFTAYTHLDDGDPIEVRIQPFYNGSAAARIEFHILASKRLAQACPGFPLDGGHHLYKFPGYSLGGWGASTDGSSAIGTQWEDTFLCLWLDKHRGRKLPSRDMLTKWTAHTLPDLLRAIGAKTLDDQQRNQENDAKQRQASLDRAVSEVLRTKLAKLQEGQLNPETRAMLSRILRRVAQEAASVLQDVGVTDEDLVLLGVHTKHIPGAPVGDAARALLVERLASLDRPVVTATICSSGSPIATVHEEGR